MDDPNSAFYPTMAQVIPTVLIAFLVAHRTQRTRQGWATNWPNAIALMLPIFLGLAGTWLAIDVIASGETSEARRTIIWFGFASSVGGIAALTIDHFRPVKRDPFLPAPANELPDPEPVAVATEPPPPSSRPLLAVIAGLLAAVLAVLLRRR